MLTLKSALTYCENFLPSYPVMPSTSTALPSWSCPRCLAVRTTPIFLPES